MGRLTNYIGGQVVTDTGIQEERQFIVDLDSSETRVAGNLYFTATEITNSVALTALTRVGSGNIPFGGGTVTFTVSGDEGAAFTITNSNGPDVTGVVGVTGVSANVDLSINADNDGGTVAFGVAIRTSDPETVFGDDFDVADRTISITQDAQPSIFSAVTWTTPGLAANGPWHTATGNAFNFSAFSGQSYSSPTSIDFINNTGQTVTFTAFGDAGGIDVTTMSLRFWLSRGDNLNFADSSTTFANGYDNDEGGFQLNYSSPTTAGPTGGPGNYDIGFDMSAPGYRTERIVISRLTLS